MDNANYILQSHSGVTMAKAFQDMLEQFGLTEKILAVNADNTSSNDTQTAKLDKLDNSFDEENRVRCFNHTIQLSAKSLLKPFNVALSGKLVDGDVMTVHHNDDDDDGGRAILKDEEEEEGEDEVEDEVEDNNIDELEELSDDEQKQILEETAIMCTTVTKVSSYAIMKQKMFAFCFTNYILICRFDNWLSQLLIQPPSLSLLGIVSATNLISRNASSLVIL
jgi:hypothetical protein